MSKAELEAEIKRLKSWVADLQSGMYVNCVYCGHRYGPADKVSGPMSEALTRHIEQCPEHPMSKLIEERDALRRECNILWFRLTGNGEVDPE